MTQWDARQGWVRGAWLRPADEAYRNTQRAAHFAVHRAGFRLRVSRYRREFFGIGRRDGGPALVEWRAGVRWRRSFEYQRWRRDAGTRGRCWGVAGPSGSAGAAGANAGTGSCPDLQTAPTDCPAKVFPDNAIIGKQADADALAGYTEIDGALTIIRNGASDLQNLDALRCLQKIHFELSVTRADSLLSLDGLKELTEIGGWVLVDDNEALKLGCGLRKLSKIGTHSATPYVEFERNAALDRVELSLLGSGVSHFRIDGNAALKTVVGSPALMTVGQFFIRSNPALTSVSGFDGLKTASEVRLDTNPMLPICQVSKIVSQLTAPPPVVETGGNLGDSCP